MIVKESRQQNSSIQTILSCRRDLLHRVLTDDSMSPSSVLLLMHCDAPHAAPCKNGWCLTCCDTLCGFIE